jgi:hypothetical protein
MDRLRWYAALALLLVSTSLLPVGRLHASTVQGTAVTIAGLDDLSATADQQARKGAGKVFAMLLGMGGLASILSGRIGLGLGGLGAGLAMGFVPGMVSTAFDSAPAATLVGVPSAGATAWWAPATLGLYPGLLLLRLVQDPVALACGLLAVGLGRMVRTERAGSLRAR